MIKRVQDTPSASESCLQWIMCYWFWCVNLVLLRINQVRVPKYPMSGSTKHTPIFCYFVWFSIDIFTMTNTRFSLKTYHDKITALKHKSTACRLSELKQALAQQQHGGHTQPQRITPAGYHRHICALTLKSHTPQTLANNVNDNRKWPFIRTQKRFGQLRRTSKSTG